ncbi:MAG: DUF3943 domain-containing protein [Candidatus Thiodiazotropha sp. (ex Lucinoma borealis)]|nr:DUF3943 domain-containing protein [Candidatus Thiodiazotropha sp. (ex Lucinoma borealis)]
MKRPMQRLFVGLFAMLLALPAQSREWLSESPVSFYEMETTKRSWTLNPHSRYAGLTASLDTAQEVEPADRPYGFGRELDDTSPADFPGLTHDAAYFFGYQFFIVGLLYVMPENVSAWSEEQKEEYTFEKWWDNVSHPRWDPDEWYINYILHPYWGMTYYTRGRERGLTEVGAFWFSFTLSSIYEFGLEALFEPVSVQDVIFTPAVGSLLGWYFEGTRREIKSQTTFSFWDKTILITTDPLGTLNTMVDNLFGVGVESELEMRSFYQSPNFTHLEIPALNDPYVEHSNPVVKDYIGLQLTLHWH